MYNRASASDYDDWKNVHENPGWGSDELIPLLKKVTRVRGRLGRPFSFFLFYSFFCERNLCILRMSVCP